MQSSLVLPFNKLSLNDVHLVGGKNASLGELIRHLQPFGINIPDGFATTAFAFREFLKENELKEALDQLMLSLDLKEFSNLNEISKTAKKLILKAKLSDELVSEINQFYNALNKKHKRILDVAVRSSATAEDLPNASFAGQHDSFLNIKGEKELIDAVHHCFASLYNARAIKYRIDNGFKHSDVALSTGIQMMVRSDLASSGVCFTIEPDSGFQNVIVITSCWGLGENIVQGAVTPDEFHVFKPLLGKVERSIISKKIGSKAKTMVYDSKGSGTINLDTPIEKQKTWTINDEEISTLAKWAKLIEKHYKLPMDIEWAKDGNNDQLYIVQARPETVQISRDPYTVKEYVLEENGKILVQGSAVGNGITTGIARVLSSSKQADHLQKGEILVTDITNPDWDPIMKKAAAIITNKGGRTSHAAIVARELGALAIVGANGATTTIKDGDFITVDNSVGKIGNVYSGELPFHFNELNFRNLEKPKTQAMLIMSDPDKAYRLSFYPNDGVGLLRMEFAINNSIRIHPMALVKYDELTDLKAQKEIEIITEQYRDKKEYFVDKLSQAVGTIAAAFYPKDVIVRMSDFKTNEYANLIGGRQFEEDEENPMLGFRGASRYYNKKYRDGFQLECEAMKRVRNEMGLRNVKLMIPFCRTVDEGWKVISVMKEFGLKRGENDLEIYVMIEVPSNVICAVEFARIFDGFSIGSNDLTQLMLGIDRDSQIISSLFDENNSAVKSVIARIIETAKLHKVKIGLCGQAPSDSTEFAAFLIRHNIDSISFNPDALVKGIKNMTFAETLKQSVK